MVKFLIISFLLFFNSVCFIIQADNITKNVAEEHFAKKEWEKALGIYNSLIRKDMDNIELYAPSIISAGKCNSYDMVISYITISENSGLPLDSVLKKTFILSLKTRSTDVYEKTLQHIKNRRPTLNNFINNLLLEFYFNRKDNVKCIEVADEIIEEKPKNIVEIMVIKAKAMNDMGDINSAIGVMEDVLSIDKNNIDARIFLGFYYYISAKQSIKDGNFTVKIPEKKGRKNSNVKYINTDIYSALKRAKNYLCIDGFSNKSPYIQNILKEIDDMINAFETPII